MRKKKLNLIDEDEEDGVEMKGKRREAVTVDVEEEDDDGDEDLDEFENDGFIVDDDEEEERVEQDGNEKQKKKKRKRKSLKDIVLDDDDLELLQDNKTLGLYQPKTTETKIFKRLKKAGKGTELAEHSGFSDGDGSLFDGSSEEEEGMSDEAEDEMDDFIVDDEEIYENGALVRQRKLNGKRPKQAPKVSSFALEEAGSIFGTADELLKRRKQSLPKNVKPDDFKDVFIVDNHMTERNDCIRLIDMPERMQIFVEIAGPAPVGKMSLEEESSWILSQLASNMYPLFSKKKSLEGTEDGTDLLSKIKREDIMRFLELHHVENYDIPFIAMYRKEMCRSLLEDPEQEEAVKRDENDTGKTPRLKWHKVLWIIKELDRKWLLVQKRKSALQMYYNQRYEEHHIIYNDARHTLKEQLFESIIRALKMAETERDIDDVDMKFSLHFPPIEMLMDGKFRRPKRKSHYTNCSEAGLWQLAGKFGQNYEQFGLQISLEKVGMEFWEDADESPMDVASKYLCPIFETPESVLRGARHMAAVEMSCEPGIRKHVRSIFMDKAVVSTIPTPEGDLAIDSFHQFAGVKWLRDKPVSKFDDSQWLLIQKAEEEKLLKVTIRLPESILDKLFTYCNDIYLRDGDGRSARLWNEQRKLILHDSFSNFILPSMEKEARALLTARAKIWLLIEYGKQLWDKVSVAPYQRKNVAGLDEGIAPKVMACCWGPGKPEEITFVMLGSSGNLLDVLHAGSLCRRSKNVNDQQRKKNDEQRVLKFMLHHQPCVVILGAVNAFCAWLKDAIKEIVNKMVEENSRDVGQPMDAINVVYGDESLPQLYERSQISSDHLPGQPGIVKRAVALGRYLQNPLAMVATLCGAQREILSWKLSSLEHLLTADEKSEMIEWVMVDVTNQVGVDINLAISQDWHFATMQFVSGLGSQKSAFLRRELVEGNVVSNRKELVGFGLQTKKVFYNAIGFIRVRGSELLSIGSENDLLDDTRIHPESYGLAEKLAMAICKDVAEVQPIKYIKDNLQLLNEFCVNDYADNYEIEGEDRRETLNDIKMELLHGFLDPRKPYEEPTQDEEFYMISGKNVDSIAEGRIVQTIVRQVQSHRAFCALDSGLTGIVMKDDYTEESDDFALTDKLHEGDILMCKIKQIDKNRFQVFLTCKESEMKSNRYQNFCEVDPYYSGGPSISITKQEKACKEDELAKKLFKPRMIVHPRFRNMTRDQAMEFLSDKDVGENIFRPSSRGPSYVTLTLKICNGLCVHKDIFEGGKDHKDITSFLHLGKMLKIGDDIFEDLDEVIDRYVDPLVTHLKAMLTFRKFKRGSKSEVDEILRAEKSEYSARIVYCFGISYEHPGTFILSYIRTTNLHHEYIGLHPKGFKFRKHTFQKVDQLVAYFQKHIDDLKHNSAPIRNPASGSSAGGSDAGWQGALNSSRDGSSGSRGRNYYNRGGRGRGRGRGRAALEYGHDNSSNENEDSVYGTDSKWGLDFKNGDGSDGGWSNFHGDKIQNSSREEPFPGGWSRGVISDSGGSWDGVSGWNEGSRGGSADGGNWSGHGDSQGASGSNRGGRGGRGRGHGREHDSYNIGDDNTNKETFTGGWGGSGSDSACGLNSGGGGNTVGWGGSNNGGNASGGSWGGNEGGGRGRGGNWGSGMECGRGIGYNNGDEGGNASGGSWGGNEGSGRGRGGNRGTGRECGRGSGYNNGEDGGNASGGSWGGNEGGGRGRGGNRGSGRGGGRGSGYNNGDEWGGSGSDSAGVINWGGGGSGSTGGWGGSNEGENASGGSWGGNEGGGRGRGGNRGSGRECGRGSGYNNGDEGGNASGGSWGGNEGGGRSRGGNRGSGRGGGRGTGYNNGDKWGGSGSDSAGVINWGGGGSAGGWGGSNEGENASGGSWGGNEGGGRGRGGNQGSGRGGGRGGGGNRGSGRGGGRVNGYKNGDEWGGSGSDSVGGINWGGGGSTDGWCGSNEGGNASGGSWGGNEGSGRGRGGDWGRGRRGGRGIGGNRGGDNVRGRGRGRGRSRGCSNGRGDNSCHEGDFRYNASSWGSNASHGDTVDGGSYFPGGSAGGNSSGGRGGSTDSETGNTGWGAGSGKNSTLSGDGRGWGGRGSHDW